MATSRTDNFPITYAGAPIEVRFVYTYLAKKREKDWRNQPIKPEDQEYETTILIPKRPDDLMQQPYVGPKDLVPRVWQAWSGQPESKGQWRPGARWPVLDCDAVNPATGGGQAETEPFAKDKPWAAGHWRIKASSQFPVGVYDVQNAPITINLYGEYIGFKAGDYGYASVHCWAYLTGSGGVGFGIEAIKKTRDGESIGGGQRSPEQIFGGAPAPSAQPALPGGFQSAGVGGYAPPAPQGYVPPQQPAYGAPQPGFSAPQQPAYPAPGPSAPSGYPPAPGPAIPYPSSPPQGQPVYGGTPPGYGGMPPAPPVPFGTR